MDLSATLVRVDSVRHETYQIRVLRFLRLAQICFLRRKFALVPSSGSIRTETSTSLVPDHAFRGMHAAALLLEQVKRCFNSPQITTAKRVMLQLDMRNKVYIGIRVMLGVH